jgi:hypothetical protein
MIPRMISRVPPRSEKLGAEISSDRINFARSSCRVEGQSTKA